MQTQRPTQVCVVLATYLPSSRLPEGLQFSVVSVLSDQSFLHVLTYLVIIFAGALLGFTLARLSYLNLAGNAKTSFASGAVPGEWYWYHHGFHRVGITVHLGTVLPAGLLITWQFVPVIRHKLLLFHRINGCIIIILVLISNVGALMICRVSFGGTLPTQAGVGVVAIITTVSIAMAYYNIKRLQIDQHRAWMLRAMFYLATIITLRLIMLIAASITSLRSTYYEVMPCGELRFVIDNDTDYLARYPRCGLANSTDDMPAVVQATLKNGYVEQIGASYHQSFGMAMWLAIFLHGAGIEIYLRLTPREGERLRQASYERQMEKGYMPAGSAGLTVDRFGDADKWRPAVPEVITTEKVAE